MRLLPMRPAMWRGTLAGRGHLVSASKVARLFPHTRRTRGLWLSGFLLSGRGYKDTWLLNTPGVKGFERC